MSRRGDASSFISYTPACIKLIAKFKSLKSVLDDVVPDVGKFMDEYHVRRW